MPRPSPVESLADGKAGTAPLAPLYDSRVTKDVILWEN